MTRVFRGFLILGISTVVGGVTYACTIQTNPGDSQISYKQGVSKVQRGDYQGAINDLSQAINLNPNYAEAYVNRGIA